MDLLNRQNVKKDIRRIYFFIFYVFMDGEAWWAPVHEVADSDMTALTSNTPSLSCSMWHL